MIPSVVALLAQVNPKFVPAPGHEPPAMAPGEMSMMVIWEGTYAYLSTEAMTFLVLPTLAVSLYALGFRVAGPLVGLFAFGLFLARMFDVPA